MGPHTPYNHQPISEMGAVVPGSDIAEMGFVVLMMATNDMDSDLKTIMAEVNSITSAKAGLRKIMDILSQLNTSPSPKNTLGHSRQVSRSRWPLY